MKIRFLFLVVTVMVGIESSKAEPQLNPVPTDPPPTTEVPVTPPPTPPQHTHPPHTHPTTSVTGPPPLMPPTLPPPTCMCPETCAGVADDLNDEYILNVIKHKAVSAMWASPDLELKGDEMKMKEIVLRMSNSDSQTWHENAFVNSIWLWNLLPYASEEPSLCPFAEMVEATLDWERKKDSKAVADAIDKIADVLLEAAHAAGNTALEKAGCPALGHNKFKKHKCYKKGTTYPADELWQLKGGAYPCAYESATKILYRSDMFSSQLMSIMATCSISQPFHDFTEHFDNNLLYELGILRISDRIPTCCCEERSRKLINLFDQMKIEAKHAASLVKSKYR